MIFKEEHFIREVRNYLKDLIAKKERLELRSNIGKLDYPSIGRLVELKDIILKLETIFIQADIRI